MSVNPLSPNPCKIFKHTQTIRRQQRTNCLSLFDHFVGFALKGLKKLRHFLEIILSEGVIMGLVGVEVRRDFKKYHDRKPKKTTENSYIEWTYLNK